MNETFKVGEVAIYWRPESPHHGKEVEILEELKFHPSGFDFLLKIKTSPRYGYRITDLNPHLPGYQIAEPHELRKKCPPEELSSWDQVQEICGWNPEKQVCRT